MLALVAVQSLHAGNLPSCGKRAKKTGAVVAGALVAMNGTQGAAAARSAARGLVPKPIPAPTPAGTAAGSTSASAVSGVTDVLSTSGETEEEALVTLTPCGGDTYKPRPEEEMPHLGWMVDKAVKAYEEGGCMKDMTGGEVCPEPEVWKADARPRNAKEENLAILLGHDRLGTDAGSNNGDAFTYATELDNYVCVALNTFVKATRGPEASAKLFNRLLEGVELGVKLKATKTRSEFMKSVLEAEVAVSKKAGLSSELAEWHLALVETNLGLANRALNRWEKTAAPLIFYMLPTLERPVVELAEL